MGDQKQLPSVSFQGDISETQIIKDLCNNTRFILETVHRSDDMGQIYKELISNTFSPEPFHTESWTQFNKHIVYTNSRRLLINRTINELRKPEHFITVERDEKDRKPDDDYKHTEKFHVYEKLPVVAYKGDRSLEIFKAMEGEIVSFDNETITVLVDGDTTLKMSHRIFMKYFDIAYAITCHKVQGSEINEPFAIHEWERACNRWRYTAITRSTKKEYINIIC